MRLWFLLPIILLIGALSSRAQNTHAVQVKAFDLQLKPMANLQVAINKGEFFTIGPRGTTIVEVPVDDLPPTSLSFRNDELEAESWNYSKGILEIIVRKKSYRVADIFVKHGGKPVANVPVTFKGAKPFNGTTTGAGTLQLALGLTERVLGPEQFTVEGYRVTEVQPNGLDYAVLVEPIQAANMASRSAATKKLHPVFDDFDLKQLDSIRSLTVFYAIFKNYRLGDLSDEEKAMVDLKFRQLITQLEDSIRKPGQAFLGRISDSSFVGEDVKNLLAQAESEEETLDYLRESFDQKIRVLNEKLSGGAARLDAETRSRLLGDINRLETILRQNEQKFYKNQNDYRLMLNSLKENFFDIEDLENRLSISEAQRVEDKQEFRRRLFTVVLVSACFAVVAIMLFYFSNRLKKQKDQLEMANLEIQRINENLEALVSERTALLESAHREMDIFLYKASHDLRGPICSIIGLCNIASRTVNEESLELVQKTYNTAFAMDRMLKKLKTISEINHPTNFSLVLLDEHIRSVKTEFSKFIRDNRVEIRIDCPAAISFHSYPNLVDVILSSLVENALYFSTVNNASGARIEIKALHQKSHVEISVTDNGIGIEEGIREKVWDMFFIGSEHSHGNGLGLYIVQKSVQVLGGSIELDSRKGVYTKVTVCIPVQEPLLVPPRETQLVSAGAHV